MPAPRMDAFTRAYFEAALWASTDNSDDQGGDPLDKNYSNGDIADATRDKMIADCADFQQRFSNLLEDDESPAIEKWGRDELAGHDFWLTRNGHGAGFWDGNWPKNGDALTEASKEYGEFDLYVGDDGEIHGSPLDRAPRAREARGVAAPRRAPRATTGRWTVEAGRAIYFDGEPFAHIDREREALPVEADQLVHFAVECLNSAGMTPDELYKRAMGIAKHPAARRS